MIKLTRTDPAGDVYINASHISSIEGYINRTIVRCGNYAHDVKETAEQIMAMPEVLYAMYPPMVAAR